KPCRYALAREPLQRDESVGAGERAQDRARIAIDVVIDVGAAQTHDQRPVGITFAEGADAVGAAPRVESNHQVCGGSVVARYDVNAMSELAQDPRPAQARCLVSRP